MAASSRRSPPRVLRSNLHDRRRCFHALSPQLLEAVLQLPRLPIEMAGHNLGLQRQAPQVGEHTREVLLEAGYSAAEIDELAGKGAVILSG